MRLFLALSTFLSFPGLVLADAADPHAGHDHGPAASAPAVAQPAVPSAKAPKIHFARPKFDFGNVDEGPKVTHRFRFHNNGKTTLKITNVATSCGCTAAVVGGKYPISEADKTQGVKSVVPPGGFDVIEATYDTQGRPGKATKVITVSSNDPVNPNFQLQFEVTVIREVEVTPERAYLFNLHQKEPRASSVTLLGKPGVPLKVFSAESVNKMVVVDGVAPYKDETGKREGAVVNFTVPGTLPAGPLADEILIKTDHPKKPEVKVPVTGEIEGRVVVEPKSIFLQARQEAPMVVRFRVNQPKGFSIRSVKSEKHLVRPSIKRTVGPDGNDQYEMNVVSVKNVPADSDGKDRILITTNDPDQAEISVEVTVGK